MKKQSKFEWKDYKAESTYKLFEDVANTAFLQSQNDSGVCSRNLLPAEGNTNEGNDGSNCSGKYCFEASSLATLEPPPLGQTWMNWHKLVSALYRECWSPVLLLFQGWWTKRALYSKHSDTIEPRRERELVHVMETSLSASLSSGETRITSSPPCTPRRDDFFFLHENREHFQSLLVCEPQILQMLKEGHQIILENQLNFGLYVQEKRDGWKRRQ